jgi:hypothetical protein
MILLFSGKMAKRVVLRKITLCNIVSYGTGTRWHTSFVEVSLLHPLAHVGDVVDV